MNLKSLSDQDLVFRTHELVRREREVIAEVLWHLREIERRMIYAQRGYSSLIEYCIKELHYSEGSAYRRVQAMQILRELPEVEKKLQTGALNLTHLTQAQKFFKESTKAGEKPTAKQKQDVLDSLENLSKREAEKTLAEINPSLNLSGPVESERCLKGNRVELTVVLTAELQEQLEEIEILLGKRGSKAELIAFMAEQTLGQLKRERNQKENLTQKKVKSKVAIKKCVAQPPVENFSTYSPSETLKLKTSKRRKAIPRPTVRALKERDQCRCQYRDPASGRQCEARFHLEIDHVQAHAKGGGEELKNLQLLCRSHNALRAVKEYGPAWMQNFIPALR